MLADGGNTVLGHRRGWCERSRQHPYTAVTCAVCSLINENA